MVTIVREATPSDAPALIELYRELSARTPTPTVEQATQTIADMAAIPGLHLIVAEVDGEVAGTLMIVLVPNLTHAGRPWAQIENVVVLEKFRRRGVGQALIDRCAEITKAAGGYKMQLISSDIRKEAHAFYKSVGFHDEFRGFKMNF